MLLPDQPRMLRQLASLAPIAWPAPGRSKKQPLTRDESRRRQMEPPTFLQRLLGRVHAAADPIAMEGAMMAYVGLLDRALEDRHLSESEADALVEMATSWGLSGEQIPFVHRQDLHQLAHAAVADGVVAEAERRDLTLVARLLGQTTQDLHQLLQQAAARATPLPSAPRATPPAEESLTGRRVCFTGELLSCHNGQPISRELAEELAARAGLIVMDSVTKKLDLLVVADPHSQSAKAKKARQCGIRIMHELVFWKTIGMAVD